MIHNNVTFDSFMSLPSKDRKRILDDVELLKTLVKHNMSKSRYQHSLNVADVCEKLASKHHVDIRKAYLAGLLHDICKDIDKNELDSYLRYYDPAKLNNIYGAYHSWVGPYYLKEKLNFHDKDILNAIYNHTICSSRDKLSLILYIADKREPLRNVNDDILQIAEKDLYEAYNKLKKDVERYIKEKKNERFIENCV